jgi:di- and tripeptidase
VEQSRYEWLPLLRSIADVNQKFNSRFEEVGGWVAHEGTMLASATGRFKDRQIYATGGNDNSVGIWDLTEFFMTQEELPPISNGMPQEY